MNERVGSTRRVFLAVSEAMRQVRSDGVAVRKSGLTIDVAGQRREAVVDVMPLRPPTSFHCER
jgi:hypothetical protein